MYISKKYRIGTFRLRVMQGWIILFPFLPVEHQKSHCLPQLLNWYMCESQLRGWLSWRCFGSSNDVPDVVLSIRDLKWVWCSHALAESSWEMLAYGSLPWSYMARASAFYLQERGCKVKFLRLVVTWKLVTEGWVRASQVNDEVLVHIH